MSSFLLSLVYYMRVMMGVRRGTLRCPGWKLDCASLVSHRLCGKNQSHATSIPLRSISVRAAPYTFGQKQSASCKHGLSVFVRKCMALVFAKMYKICIDRN